MGTEDQKPVAEEGHTVGSCEATIVVPVHKVLPFFVSAMLLCVCVCVCVCFTISLKCPFPNM